MALAHGSSCSVFRAGPGSGGVPEKAAAAWNGGWGFLPIVFGNWKPDDRGGNGFDLGPAPAEEDWNVFCLQEAGNPWGTSMPPVRQSSGCCSQHLGPD